jgi:hypothetical protein
MAHLEELNAHVMVDIVEDSGGVRTTTLVVRKKDGTLLASIVVLPRTAVSNIQGMWEVTKL